jgi:hypothetical protein
LIFVLGAPLGVFKCFMAYLVLVSPGVNVVTMNIERAVRSDFDVIKKVMLQTLRACGYKVGDSSVEITRGFGCDWIIEFKIAVER